MNTILAKEIKRRGIRAVDNALKTGPVHIIKNDKPCYVILTEEHYQELNTKTHAPRRLARAFELLTQLPDDFFSEGRNDIPLQKRDFL